MARRKKIVVTQDDIDGGKRKSTQNCPLTFAIERATGLTSGDVAVGYSDVYLAGGMRALPDEAVEFIELFDKQGKKAVKPFTFKLKVD